MKKYFQLHPNFLLKRFPADKQLQTDNRQLTTADRKLQTDNCLLKFCFLLLLPVAFSSCTRNLFLPSTVYSPQLRDKHEGEIGIVGNGNSGVQVQTAFAFTEHFGLQAQANAISTHSGDFLGGPNYWLKFKLDERNTFLIEFSAGYSCGTYKKYVSRATGTGASGNAALPGYLLFDVFGKWHGGYCQYSIGARLDNKFSMYTGTRFQILNCEQFRYNTQFFAEDSSRAGHFIPGTILTVNSRHGFTTLAEVFVGLNFGWQHFHFFFEAQFRSQYNARNLNDNWKVPSSAIATAGITFLFGNKDFKK